jgi:hypothetical protein
MNRKQRRMMEREYEKNKLKLTKHINETYIPTEQEIQEYINKRFSPTIMEPIKVTQEMSDELKEYYKTK